MPTPLNTPNNTPQPTKKTWVAPVLIEEDIKQTQGGRFLNVERGAGQYSYHS
ncbi:hypothetical protein BH09BAC6_BH09BAC6_11790 [soil metagenome]|jgi:hypothetical protein